MNFSGIFRKRAIAVLFLLFFLFLTGCAPKCPAWHYEQILTSTRCFNSSRILIFPHDLCSTLELELVRDTCGTNMYVNVMLLEAPCWEGDVSHAPLLISCGEIDTEALAYRFRGGQRLLLTEEVRDMVIASLWTGNAVEVRLGRHRQVFTCAGFRTAYSKLSD